MTQEEAKQLKPGDRVLIEAKVMPSGRENPYEHITIAGNVALKVETRGTSTHCNFICAPSAVREKITPASRAFRKGDITCVAELVSSSLGVIQSEKTPDRKEQI